jgi:Arc/MetJ-type ribon-helix-helix transcriptional regulator
METRPVQISLTPALYRQLTRLKVQGQFISDSDLLQASFESLEKSWERSAQHKVINATSNKPYMSRPALGIEDYDT